MSILKIISQNSAYSEVYEAIENAKTDSEKYKELTDMLATGGSVRAFLELVGEDYPKRLVAMVIKNKYKSSELDSELLIIELHNELCKANERIRYGLKTFREMKEMINKQI